MNIRSIRFKLILWYMLMLVLTLSVFSILLYNIFSNSIKSSSDVLLRSRAEGIANSIDTYWETERLEAIKDGVVVEEFSKVDNINFAKIARRWVEERSDDPQLIGIIVQIYGADGGRIAYSRNIPSISILSKATFDYVLRGKSRFDTITIDLPESKPEDLRAFTMPVLENNKVAYIVQVARPLIIVSSARHALKMLLFILLPLTVLLTGIIGSILARFANLERSFMMQKQFIEDLSHELKTPLSVLKGEMEVTLKKMRSPEDYEVILKSGLDETNTLIRIVENLLMLARFDSNAIALEMRQLDAAGIIRDAARDVKVLADRKKITIVLPEGAPEGASGSSARIKGDQGQIRRLFLNLLDNAVKYTPDGGRVTVDITEGDPFVKIAFIDTGVGIPAGDLPHIFDRFYRVDKSRGSVGFGLGLSICRSIVEAHRGRIEVASEPGRGSTFTVFLPH